MLNTTIIDIKITKQNINQTLVEISSLCKNDGNGVLKSPQKWKEKLLIEVNKKLGNKIENTNQENKTSKDFDYNYDKKMQSKKITRTIYLVLLVFFTIKNLFIMPFIAVIIFDIIISIIFYPIIYLGVKLFYKLIQ